MKTAPILRLEGWNGLVLSRNARRVGTRYGTASRRRLTGGRAVTVRGARGFTLLELLVVIGIIAVLSGLSALTLGGRAGDGAALAGAQAMVAALAGAARAQAALHHVPARLVIQAEPAPHGQASQYLRALLVVREDPVDSGRFIAAGDVMLLPSPVCMVPTAPVPPSNIGPRVSWNSDPSAGAASAVATESSFSYRAHAGTSVSWFFGATGSGRAYYVEFDPTGAVRGGSNAGTRIVLSTALLTPGVLPQFNNPGALRTVTIRGSGAISQAGVATGFSR